jgi:uncharacterized protein (DUF433 family)
MQLEDYFDFLASNDIRLKGHRIGIESILYEYIHNGQSPEAIRERFPTLSLDQVYATILYYLQNKSQIERYFADWLEHGERMRAQQAQKSLPIADKLRKLRGERLQHRKHIKTKT